MKIITSLASPFPVMIVEKHTDQEIYWIVTNLTSTRRINEIEINDSSSKSRHALVAQSINGTSQSRNSLTHWALICTSYEELVNLIICSFCININSNRYIYDRHFKVHFRWIYWSPTKLSTVLHLYHFWLIFLRVHVYLFSFFVFVLFLCICICSLSLYLYLLSFWPFGQRHWQWL